MNEFVSSDPGGVDGEFIALPGFEDLGPFRLRARFSACIVFDVIKCMYKACMICENHQICFFFVDALPGLGIGVTISSRKFSSLPFPCFLTFCRSVVYQADSVRRIV